MSAIQRGDFSHAEPLSYRHDGSIDDAEVEVCVGADQRSGSLDVRVSDVLDPKTAANEAVQESKKAASTLARAPEARR